MQKLTTSFHFIWIAELPYHIVNDANLFANSIKLNPPIKIAVAKNDVFILATRKGNIKITSNMGINGVLENVL